MSNLPGTGLTPEQLAALTVRVPCSQNETLDAVITQSLRFQVAAEYMVRAVLHFKEGSQEMFERRARTAVLIADVLIQEFQRAGTKKPAAK